jgi:hypothetical protein
MTVCTEKEAAEKWCPHMKRDIDRGANFVIGPEGRTFFPICIGSRCMQWRWVETMNLKPIGENPRGYCGLAGKP